MQNTVFIINERFLIDIERSELIDKTTGEKNRLEPRLMKLLHLLTAQHGKVVRREFIIKEIWDNYPGAGEGLNQAISFLRKLLADENKSIIQTQPKVGYSFHAVISQVGNHRVLFRKRYVSIVLGVFVLALLLFFAINISMRKNLSRMTDRQFIERNDAEISRQDSIRQAEQMKRFAKDTLGPAARGDSLRPK